LEVASGESSSFPETEYQKKGEGWPMADNLIDEGTMLRLPE